MKKALSWSLCAFLLCAAAGCSGGKPAPDAVGAQAARPDSPAAPLETPAEPEPVSPPESAAEKKAAVVYFSCTGNTAAIAETIAGALGAPVFEITPAKPYTSEDLNDSSDSCRAKQEQNDDSARPEIASELSEIEGYATIYIGYPIWWGTHPKIMETFLDAYDLSTAAVYTFCTSGSSGIETSVSHLQEQYPNVTIISGRRFASSASEADIEDWLTALE